MRCRSPMPLHCWTAMAVLGPYLHTLSLVREEPHPCGNQRHKQRIQEGRPLYPHLGLPPWWLGVRSAEFLSSKKNGRPLISRLRCGWGFAARNFCPRKTRTSLDIAPRDSMIGQIIESPVVRSGTLGRDAVYCSTEFVFGGRKTEKKTSFCTPSF